MLNIYNEKYKMTFFTKKTKIKLLLKNNETILTPLPYYIKESCITKFSAEETHKINKVP